MTQMFTKQNISYGLILLSFIVLLTGLFYSKPKQSVYYYTVTMVLFIIGVILMFTSLEKFHVTTHKIMLGNEKGENIPCGTKNLSDCTLQEIPKTQETPYKNDCTYKKELESLERSEEDDHQLYEDFEQEQEPSQEPVNELPDNETPFTTMTQPDIEDCVYVPRVFKSLPNKHNRGLGDYIRGDLPIMPKEIGWFRPSASPNDLQKGALSVIGGENNEQGKAIEKLTDEWNSDAS